MVRFATAALLVLAAGSLGAQQTTVTLTTSANPVVFGRPLTLTATVSPAAASGSVTFYDGTTVVGAQTLVGGQASLTTNFLAAGARSLRAYYGGGGSYGASTSAVLPQTVQTGPANGFQAPLILGGGLYSATGLYSSVVVGDFNGDGKADMAAANGTLWVFLGKGDGTFQTPVSYPAGSDPRCIAVADFNRDGKTDLAVGNTDGSVSVLLGNGNGTFQPAITYVAALNLSSVVVGDFDGDGKADLVVVNSAYNLSILLGNGDGTFRPAVAFASETFPNSVVVGDFNGDGKADLAVTQFGPVPGPQSQVFILIGNGDGTFQAPQGYLGVLTTWPTGQAQPNVSTLNSYSGAVVANAAMVPAGSCGAISVYVSDATDLVLDINGYFGP